MVHYNLGADYVAQLGTLLLAIVVIIWLVYLHKRMLTPIIERVGMVERVKMAMYEKELEKHCKEVGVDYSKIDVDLGACYKKKNNKLKERLQEIEDSM